MISDLTICREMHWTLDDLLQLPIDRYGVLVEWLAEEFKARTRTADE